MVIKVSIRDVNKTFNRKTETRPRPSIFHKRRDRDQDLECRDRDVVRDLPEFNKEEEHPQNVITCKQDLQLQDQDETETLQKHVSRLRRRDRDCIPGMHAGQAPH
jgi:hypothetical protein